MLYGVSGFTFFLIGGLEALLLRTQLAVPNGDVIDADRFNQLFTMHALTMIFLAIMPLGAAFFNFFIPLMIGARDVAFPRLNALSYWVFISGGVLLTSSFVFGGAPDAGWFAYAPLTSEGFSPGNGMDFYVVGLLLLGLSSMMASLNFAVTIINMRAPGMTMMRLPVYIWMALIRRVPAHPLAAGSDRRPDSAALRSPVHDGLLRPVTGRRSDPLAAHLLDLRTPGGLCPHSPGHGHHL